MTWTSAGGKNWEALAQCSQCHWQRAADSGVIRTPASQVPCGAVQRSCKQGANGGKSKQIDSESKQLDTLAALSWLWLSNSKHACTPEIYFVDKQLEPFGISSPQRFCRVSFLFLKVSGFFVLWGVCWLNNIEITINQIQYYDFHWQSQSVELKILYNNILSQLEVHFLSVQLIYHR